MLYYNKITKSKRIDEIEGQDCIGITNLKSKQCYCCLSYFFVTNNFKYELHLCNHCHCCILREKVPKSALFRIKTTKRGIFRTFWEYEHVEVVNLIEKLFINEKAGLLHKYQNKRVEV